MLPRPTIEAFDRHLASLGLRFEGVVIVEQIFEGQSLVLSTLGRPDLLKSKLFALCDRGTDMPDSIALAPTAEELAECLPWLELQDGNELWPDHVRATVGGLRRRLGHGV
jgi:hypothetical protein